ncbi:transporter [Saccharomonospora piscinae]|uniref:PH-like domain-containing protein n=1 Tax=Saccharomonospora piscinae TaxID=687388 RepID=UPI001105B2F0|nr:transporter [Saccharomonospora piscinae]TLW94394.1 transporter [Saccharomonospora piscinae]
MDRLLLTLLCVAFFALCLYGMWRGWRRRARAQSVRVPPFPEVPADPGTPALVTRGIYVSTTTAGHWQDRIVTRGAGMRGPAVVRLYDDGVEIERSGAPGFWIPRESVISVGTAKGMAGKVMGTDSLLVFTWRIGDVELDTGLRGDDLSVYPKWIEQVKGGAQV